MKCKSIKTGIEIYVPCALWVSVQFHPKAGKWNTSEISPLPDPWSSRNTGKTRKARFFLVTTTRHCPRSSRASLQIWRWGEGGSLHELRSPQPSWWSHNQLWCYPTDLHHLAARRIKRKKKKYRRAGKFCRTKFRPTHLPLHYRNIYIL